MTIPMMALLVLVASEGPANPKPINPIPADHAQRFEEGTKLFKSNVGAILKNRCLNCHGGEKTRGGFSLNDRKAMLAGGDSGAAVTPFDPDSSRMIRMVRHVEAPAMPEKAPPLPATEQKMLARWVELGAPYDQPLIATKPGGSVVKAVTDKDRQFRSFKPIALPSTPPNGSAQSIDNFIDAKHKEKKLQPAPEADKRTLARRIFADLVGIPPTPKELADFVEDKRPDAYERLVDKLLESPKYGERWARHWLDVARYAESHGYEQDYDRPTAYPYRDFVIKAFNSDLPYNTFLRWQIAGDEIDPNNPEAWFATGFLAAGVHATQITISQVEKERYDELDDIARTIGASMLGLSIQCARCHDHKYDPIPTRDYYRLISVFTKTVRSEKDVPLLDAGYEEKLKQWESTLVEAKKELHSRETSLDSNFNSWWKEYIKKIPVSTWVLPEQMHAASQNGSTVNITAMSEIRVAGTNPSRESLTINTTTSLKHLAAIRIEALTSPELVRQGPGRASNGNFALSNLTLNVRPAGAKTPRKKIALTRPKATFEQKGLPVAAAIDNDPMSAWAIDPKFGEDHAAIFALEKPIDSANGWDCQWLIEFNNNTGHGMGRVRLSFSANDNDVLRNNVEPAFVLAARKGSTSVLSPTDLQNARAIQRADDSVWKILNQKLKEVESKRPTSPSLKALVSSEGLPAVRLHTQGGDFLEATHFLKRGDSNQKGDIATPSFLQVLTSHPNGEKRWITTPPAGARSPHLRHALADWICDTEHGAGNLAARVIVNRLWHHHFGRGIIKTMNDFGVTGDEPTHPELLDWMASELIRNGWKLKSLHRLIVTSNAYKRSNSVDENTLLADLDNRWLTRRIPRRLEAEVVRDSLLAISGLLDTKQFGPAMTDPSHHRRAIYSALKRSRMPAMMTLFDAPDSLQSAEERPITTVAPQALLLLNSPLVAEISQGISARVLADGGEPVKQMFQRVLLREPTPREAEDASQFLKSVAQGDKKRALTELAQVLAISNEFFYVD
ncbi:MAG: PSD1 and planctomycete cytochrome C domain-containing protein [Planctomycetota bacterium]